MDYDVIVVGGRPAGASLAARLGARGVKVLVVERATFPSLPGVPSSPLLHSGAMALLDEIGIDEAGYATEHGCMRGVRFAFGGLFETQMRVPQMSTGRSCVYGISRLTFDELLWKHLARHPTVERREGFAVTDVLREDGRVVGVTGAGPSGSEERITARCVVGADGRFSLIARKVGAAVVEEEALHTSTVYFADWTGVRPVHEPYTSALVHATARGLDVLFFAMPGGRWSINTHARSDRTRVDGDPRKYYLDTLRSLPGVWRYLEDAEQISPVVGLKKIGNGYRRASGPGWALTGDALHYKDPVDGQGIYDALLESKLLDQALARFLAGSSSWEEAMSTYERDVRGATHSMFLTTVGRLKRELYDEPPLPVILTLIRWTMTDPGYQECFLRVLGRDWPPETIASKGLMAAAAVRGIGRDVSGLLERLAPSR